MKLRQLSVFLENKPGQLLLPVRVLAAAGINITTLCLADTENFGILRLILEEHERARAVLEEAGCVVNECEVLAIDVADRPGGLAEVLDSLSHESVNLEYMYAFSCGTNGKAMLVFRFDNPDEAIRILTQKGIGVVDRLTVFSRNAGLDTSSVKYPG